MNLYFRLAAIIIAAFFRGRIGIAEASRVSSRVWPFDLDLNLHMTNSRYQALADLGRVDLILRTGAWRAIWRGRMAVVLGGCTIRFRRALHPFERFTVSSEILGWDERWVYVRQIFTGRAGPACFAIMRAGFTRNGALVPPQELMEIAAPGTETLQPPEWVERWAEMEAQFVAEVQKG